MSVKCHDEIITVIGNLQKKGGIRTGDDIRSEEN
jgi:hypothetical protein